MEAGVAPRVVFLVGVLVAVSLGQGVAVAEGEGVRVEVEVRPLPHPSILIEGEEGFDSDSNPFNGVRGGTGAPDDPYRISDWVITPTRRFGILIQDTRSHVVIENVYVPQNAMFVSARVECLVSPVFACRDNRNIDLINATNVTVRRVFLAGAFAGVTIDRSADIVIEASSIGRGDPIDLSARNGLEVLRSRGVLVRNSTVFATDHPLVLSGTSSEPTDDVRVEDSTTVGLGSDSTNLLSNAVDVKFARVLFEGHGMVFRNTIGNISILHSTMHNASVHALEDDTGKRGTFTSCGSTYQQNHNPFATVDLGISPHEWQEIRFMGNIVVDNARGLRLQSPTVLFEHNMISNSSTVGESVALTVPSSGAAVHNNSFHGAWGVFLSVTGADARWNWWGDPDGPNVNGNGPGSGDPLATAGATVAYDPWLTSPPATGPDAVDCGVPKGPAGVKQGPNLTAEITVDATASVSVNEHAGPAHLHANAVAEARVSTGRLSVPV